MKIQFVCLMQRNDYPRNKYIERELHEQCVSDLHLKTLTKDDSIDPNKMIECLKNLIKAQLECRNVILHITHYYSVLADGTVSVTSFLFRLSLCQSMTFLCIELQVCIPWDWTL